MRDCQYLVFRFPCEHTFPLFTESRLYEDIALILRGPFDPDFVCLFLSEFDASILVRGEVLTAFADVFVCCIFNCFAPEQFRTTQAGLNSDSAIEIVC